MLYINTYMHICLYVCFLLKCHGIQLRLSLVPNSDFAKKLTTSGCSDLALKAQI